jgi:hypothetical protein
MVVQLIVAGDAALSALIRSLSGFDGVLKRWLRLAAAMEKLARSTTHASKRAAPRRRDPRQSNSTQRREGDGGQDPAARGRQQKRQAHGDDSLGAVRQT